MEIQKRDKKLMVILGAVVLAATAVSVWLFLIRDPASPALDIPDAAVDTVIPVSDETLETRLYDCDIVLPVGKLVITQLRAAYKSGDMRLVIPRLSLDVSVGGDTELSTLAQGPGLYKYSQIPNLYNTNVSIAAHRDLPSYDFYYLDTLTEGDWIYVVYNGQLFKYAYRSTHDVQPTNWDPIRVYYDNRVTLTTCTPLGTSRLRMIVVGELVEQEAYRADYVFE